MLEKAAFCIIVYKVVMCCRRLRVVIDLDSEARLLACHLISRFAGPNLFHPLVHAAEYHC